MLFQRFAIICVRSSLWHTISRQKEDPEPPGVRSEGELWGMQRTGLSRDETWGLGWYSKDKAGQEGCLYVEGGKGNLKQVRVVGEAVPAWALGSPGAWQSRRPGSHGKRNTAVHWSGHQRFLKMCQGSILTNMQRWMASWAASEAVVCQRVFWCQLTECSRFNLISIGCLTQRLYF